MTTTATATDVAEHLARYTDPAKLTNHLRGTHQQQVHSHEETDLATLRAIHQIAHENQN